MIEVRARSQHADAAEAGSSAENRRFRRCSLRPRKRGSRRARWVALLCPSSFEPIRNISVDLHLTDAHADLIGDGFDTALCVATRGLVARRAPGCTSTPVRCGIVNLSVTLRLIVRLEATIDAPRTGPCGHQIQKDEAEEDRRRALIEYREEAFGRMNHPIGDGHFP